MTNHTRAVHELTTWLHDALAQQAEPLHHVCRHIAHDLETGARDPADAARLLNAALDAFPESGSAAAARRQRPPTSPSSPAACDPPNSPSP